MKKLLNQFLGKRKITNRYSKDFIEFAKEQNSSFEEKELQSFFFAEKTRVQKRDKAYEKTRVKKSISFSKEEYEKIEVELDKTQIDFSTYAKGILLKKKIKLPIEKELLFQISKIGNNLNQIARAVNSKDRAAVLTELVEIEKQLKALRNGS